MLMSLLMLSFANVVKAEGIELSNAPKVWTVPAVFTADQEVTFYYDVTDVGVRYKRLTSKLSYELKG